MVSESMEIINHYLSELNLEANILPIMIPIPSAITSSALENLPGINDCHTSSIIAKHKHSTHVIIIWFLDLFWRVFILKKPKIEYSTIWISLSQESKTNLGIESPGILDIDKINIP